MIILSGDIIGFYKVLSIPIVIVVSIILFAFNKIITKDGLYKSLIKPKGVLIKLLFWTFLLFAFLILFIIVGWVFAFVLSL
ncbi:MAG: hypothetical protein CL840_21130 [Crocinitomicaceae bacterium]|nr:hypothetical protein [Crocinitomicaceae bacterium]